MLNLIPKIDLADLKMLFSRSLALFGANLSKDPGKFGF